MSNSPPDSPACSGQCHDCSVAAAAEQAAAAHGAQAMRGWSFAAAALAFFITPAFTGAAGAIVGGPEPVGQLLGAIVGLTAGLLAALAFATVCRRNLEANHP